MGLFSRRSASQWPLPIPELVAAMERFGRHEYDPMRSSEDASWPYESIIAPLYPLASNDPQAFLEMLSEHVSSGGGWAAYGAGHAVWELVTSDVRASLKDHAAYNAVIDASLAFLRRNGVPPKRLTDYEWDHWVSQGGTVATWLPPRPLPPRDPSPITPLNDGEKRPIAQVGAESDSNVILVRHENGRYVASVDARWSDEDPRRGERDWKSAAALYDLYIEVANSLQTPTPWHDREMAPFFPLATPNI